MSIVLKALVSAAVIALGAWLVWYVALEPVQCSRMELRLIDATNQAMEHNDAPLARLTWEQASRLSKRCPSNIQLRMIAAANLRQLGRPADAIRVYDEALRYDRRPEIYVNIGQSRVEGGMRKRAIDDFVRAVVFAPGMIEDVTPDLRDEVYARARAASGRPATVRNGSFSQESLLGGQELHGTGALGTSAAAEWIVQAVRGGTVRTELLPSTRKPGGKMIHVVTNDQYGGISQVWSPPGTGPARVQTEVWIYLNRGVVTIGTGNSGNVTPDAYATKTGQWVLISSRNNSCPANYTLLFSETPAGADFYVDDVRITPLNEPCEQK